MYYQKFSMGWSKLSLVIVKIFIPPLSSSRLKGFSVLFLFFSDWPMPFRSGIVLGIDQGMCDKEHAEVGLKIKKKDDTTQRWRASTYSIDGVDYSTFRIECSYFNDVIGSDKSMLLSSARSDTSTDKLISSIRGKSREQIRHTVFPLTDNFERSFC